MILAIFQNERVYEGNQNFLNAVYPMPSLSKVVIDPANPVAAGILGNQHPLTPPLFREDSFDPTTRIRRGRFYSLHKQLATYDPQRVSHYPYAPPTGGLPQFYNMDAYRSLQPAGHVPTFHRTLILLGDASHKTAWHIVGAERLFNGETLFTLKSLSTLGQLPDLAEATLPSEKRREILDGFEKVADAAHKYLPVPIVDVCREFSRVILAAWLPTVGVKSQGDLGKLIEVVPQDHSGIKSAAGIINRLHSRGKSSEQERQAKKERVIREVSDEDGELSVALVGFLLRELGWAA